MKRFTSILIVCVMFLGIIGGGGALAVDFEPNELNLVYIEPHASRYLSSYSAWASAGSSGSVVISFSVIATARFERVGALAISIQERNGTSWRTVATYFGSTTPGLMGSNAVAHTGNFTHSGSAGSEFRAAVTFFAGGSSGEQRVITTNSVFA